MNGEPRVVAIDAAATHDLRRRVLRVGTTSAAVEFPEDEFDDTVHLGVAVDGELIAISTWVVRDHPDHPQRRAVQLRAMATDPSVRGRGHGARLVRSGIARPRAAGAELVWANARTTAVDFYRARGFDVDDAEFITADTGLPHQRILLYL